MIDGGGGLPHKTIVCSSANGSPPSRRKTCCGPSPCGSRPRGAPICSARSFGISCQASPIRASDTRTASPASCSRGFRSFPANAGHGGSGKRACGSAGPALKPPGRSGRQLSGGSIENGQRGWGALFPWAGDPLLRRLSRLLNRQPAVFFVLLNAHRASADLDRLLADREASRERVQHQIARV